MKNDTRMNLATYRIALVLVALFAPSLAHAHVGVGHANGMMHGLAHPMAGLDHLVAMVAVGLWAAQCGGRSIWVVPLSFVTVMALGGLLGVMGVLIPFVEPGIMASVLVLGVLVAAAARLPLVACASLVGLFAIFHGYAHGAEMPGTVSGLAYGFGFLMATALLHAAGIGLGLLAGKVGRPRMVRYAGIAITAVGAYLWIA